MPVIKSAQKKLRKDKKRTLENKKLENILEKTIKQAVKNPLDKNIKLATKVIDKSVKKGIIHKNKGARIKSTLSRLNKKKTQKAKKI